MNVYEILKDLDFANDLALLSHRIQGMRDETRDLEVQGAKVGLKINVTKKKVMHIGTRIKRGDGVTVARGGLKKWMSSYTLGAL